MTKRDILARHRDSLKGRLRWRLLSSNVLGIRKPYYVYEAPGALSSTSLPILYLFRGHEREWVNPTEDHSRQKSTAIEDLDYLVSTGQLPPFIGVLPGLNSSNNHVPSLGIDMVGSWSRSLKGMGSGQYWQYLTKELLPHIERGYPQTKDSLRLAAGFSLGGYTVSLLATCLPGYFDHVGIYDGLFMWPDHKDPRHDSTATWTDPVWRSVALFDAALGKPRDPASMKDWNPTDRLVEAEPALLASLAQTTYWIKCASADGQQGNLDRTRFVVNLLREKNIPIGFEDFTMSPDAAHTWHWTDRFLVQFLRGVFDAL